MYAGICPEKGNIVSDEYAFQYALERVVNGTEEDKKDFVEWFYSGNWVKEDEEC